VLYITIEALLGWFQMFIPTLTMSKLQANYEHYFLKPANVDSLGWQSIACSQRNYNLYHSWFLMGSEADPH
jgi:hypothetical protein